MVPTIMFVVGVLCAVQVSSFAFQQPQVGYVAQRSFPRTPLTALASVPDPENVGVESAKKDVDEVLSNTLESIREANEKAAAAVTIDEESTYPIDLPSPLLLATSMVLAIAGTGSVFELSGGSPQFGFATTAGIAVVSIPLCFFLFYASILKATAETEEDDRNFLGK